MLYQMIYCKASLWMIMLLSLAVVDIPQRRLACPAHLYMMDQEEVVEEEEEEAPFALAAISEVLQGTK